MFQRKRERVPDDLQTSSAKQPLRIIIDASTANALHRSLSGSLSRWVAERGSGISTGETDSNLACWRRGVKAHVVSHPPRSEQGDHAGQFNQVGSWDKGGSRHAGHGLHNCRVQVGIAEVGQSNDGFDAYIREDPKAVAGMLKGINRDQMQILADVWLILPCS